MGSKIARRVVGDEVFRVECHRSTDTYYLSVNDYFKAITFESMEVILELIAESAGAAADQVDMVKRIGKQWSEMYEDH